ncbi:MAG: LuxR C-terminal-related transcriptional regulator [Actinomycetota bacterium]
MSDDVRVAIADASPIFRRGVRAVLEATPGVSVIGEPADVEAVVRLAGRCVCLWDIALDDGALRGVRAIRDSRDDIAVVVVGREGSALDLTVALSAGAIGIIDRDVDEDVLARVVLSAAQGRSDLAAGDRGALWEQAGTAARGSVPALTRRERQVLELMGRGLGNRAIADELFISENTVKNHVRSLHEKLQVHSRTEAVVRAAQEGIVEIVPRGPV